MPRPEYLYLREMRDAISRIVALIDGVPVGGDLEDDWVKADALSWNFTILGEAAAKLPEEFRAGHPEISGGGPSAYATESCTDTGQSTSTFW